ncbi:uncharacterized protein N0V89_007378 [Didymosphaeria variabile]|uniref:Uncharacterized protein n=1 Tax=Didymosphaeria variabile TaxID=1932322 RepID=A0A9W9CAF0_9PLEO|nr:uncharacterized protein N0V89_007378 [Didymosphaeria variabile]KAJ4352032.1 hypothetical protein N0V89_007378 [Didymosphaeria variabile]
MSPKKAAGAAQTAKAINKKSQAEDKHVAATDEENTRKKDEKREPQNANAQKSSHNDQEGTSRAGQKRKAPPITSTRDRPPKKNPRAGSRTSSRQPGGGTANDATAKHILNFLLSADALPYCYPSDELDSAKSGKFKKTYSLTPPSLFTPFEHLITAHLISKPLSHTLGMRSTRTLLNEPYGFSTPGKLHHAGEENIWHALEEARTQHRQKTAVFLAELGAHFAVLDSKINAAGQGDSDPMRELAEQVNERGPRATIEYIKKTVKGMGETGAQIFCRRVQACEGWGKALWPYADPRSVDALREIGVEVADAGGLQEMIEKDVDLEAIKQNGWLGRNRETKGDDADRETVFVTVLERAIGCVLEGKVGEVRSAAVAASGK